MKCGLFSIRLTLLCSSNVIILISDHEMWAAATDSSPMLVASFHRFRVDNLRALPFYSQLQRASQHRLEAIEEKELKIRLEI